MASVTGTLTAVGQQGASLYLRAGETCTVAVSRTGVGAWAAQLVTAAQSKPSVFTVVETFQANASGYTFVNQTDNALLVAVQLRQIQPAESVSFTIADVLGDQILEEWRAADGTLAFRITDQGPSGDTPGQLVGVPNATAGRRYVQVGCVIRNSGAGWAFIEDANHKPTGFTGITVNGDGDIVLTYGFTAKRVIALNVTVDETLGLAEMFVGPSVGLTTVVIKMYKPLRFWVDGTTVYADAFWGTDITASSADPNELVITHPEVFDANDCPVVSPVRDATKPTPIIACNAAASSIDVEAYGPLAGIIEYDGANFVWTGEVLTAPTFSFDGGTGTLTVDHETLPNLYGAQVSQRGSGSHRPVVQSTNAAQTLIRWMNTSDAVVTTADTNMKCYFYRDAVLQTPWDTGFRVGVSRGPAKLNANNVVSTGGNLWVLGLLEVEA